jgi:hypothetical protein
VNDPNIAVRDLLENIGFKPEPLLEAVNQLDEVGPDAPLLVVIAANSGRQYSVRIHPPQPSGKLPDHTSFLTFKVQQLLQANKELFHVASNLEQASEVLFDYAHYMHDLAEQYDLDPPPVPVSLVDFESEVPEIVIVDEEEPEPLPEDHEADVIEGPWGT